MMRSLWTAASGMIAQQTNVDTIANNLANVNTVGYKAERAEFKSLLYQTLQAKTTTANDEQKPISAQVGLGTRTSSITSTFTNGTFNETGKVSDLAINGAGFFAIQNVDGGVDYTRNGTFNWSRIDGGGFMLVDTMGNAVLDMNETPITVDSEFDINKVKIDTDGNLSYPDETNNLQSMGFRIGLFQFTNPAGLEKIGDSKYAPTANSGDPISEENPGIKPSVLRQGYVEASNVQVADEMINLIVAQRAYELNSKAITASDEMLQQANNLRR